MHANVYGDQNVPEPLPSLRHDHLQESAERLHVGRCINIILLEQLCSSRILARLGERKKSSLMRVFTIAQRFQRLREDFSCLIQESSANSRGC